MGHDKRMDELSLTCKSQMSEIEIRKYHQGCRPRHFDGYCERHHREPSKNAGGSRAQGLHVDRRQNSDQLVLCCPGYARKPKQPQQKPSLMSEKNYLSWQSNYLAIIVPVICNFSLCLEQKTLAHAA